jgi:hypothetical protein
MSIVKFQATHAVIANAPAVINVAADDPLLVQRLFNGSGAPTSSTLVAGNGRYCAATSGFVMAASLVAAGTGYVVGDILYCVVGAGTASQVARITVDAVLAGVITDYHVSTVGIYSVYSANPVTTTNSTGSGTGATFNLALQPADFYFDSTAKALYACTTAGSNSTSVWSQIGGGGAQMYAITTLSNADYFVAVPISVTFPSGVLTLAFGTAVNVAKYNRQRVSVASELIDGITVNYSSYTGDNTRTANDGTNTEYEVCYPRYVTMATLGFSSYLTTPPTGSTAYTFLTSQCVIKVVSMPTGMVVSSVPVVLEESVPRVWARRFIQ